MFETVNNCNYLLSKFLTLNQFIVVSFVLLLIFTVIYLNSFKDVFFGKFGLLTIVIGGIANLIQWYSVGCVRDFISFFGLFYFNFYDVLVTIGVTLVALSIWKKK